MESKLTPEEFLSLVQMRQAENPKYTRIANRLRELIWDQDCNDANLRLYQRLEREAIIHGDPVYRSIKSVAASALKARNPVRYFAAAICRRLREQGYMQSDGEELGL